MRYVLRCFTLLSFFCGSCGIAEDSIFLFLFAASKTRLRFCTFLVITNASGAVLLLNFFLLSLLPAAVKGCCGSFSWHSHRCRCTLFKFFFWSDRACLSLVVS